MSHILLPIDFSTPSHNAFSYAVRLADQLNLNIILAHYYNGSMNPNEPLVLQDSTSIHESYLQRLEEFSKLKERDNGPYLQSVGITFEAKAMLTVSAAIISRAEAEDIDLVVMATRSTEKTLGKWLGSTSITVSEACEKPVFLIPPEVSFVPFKKIVVANNHITADPLPLWELKSLADFYKAEVHFVHIESEHLPEKQRFVPWELMQELFREDNQVKYPFEVVTIEEEDITEGLLEYAEGMEAQLVVVVNRLRKRWKALLHASLTQDIALHSEDFPILVLHTKFDGIADRLMKSYSTTEE